MTTFSFNDLYEEYTEVRKLNLNTEQFTAFVTYYPALLVAKTDGVVDEKEWSLIQDLSNRIVNDTLPQNADKEQIKDYKKLFYSEFHYLIENLDQWDRKFMKALQQLLAEQPKHVETVAEVLYLLAKSSNGVCEKENTMIEYLRAELKITDLCKDIKVSPSQKSAKQGWLTFLTFSW